MPKPCGRCGRSYGGEAWRQLRVVDRISTLRIRDFVTAWPDGEMIEVRTCTCGQALARRVDPSFETAARA